MSKPLHTPGPWKAIVNNPMSQFFDHTVCDSSGAVITNLDGLEADAHLIAAAPEMLECLERFLTAPSYEIFKTAAMARDIVAKARGEK